MSDINQMLIDLDDLIDEWRNEDNCSWAEIHSVLLEMADIIEDFYGP